MNIEEQMKRMPRLIGVDLDRIKPIQTKRKDNYNENLIQKFKQDNRHRKVEDEKYNNKIQQIYQKEREKKKEEEEDKFQFLVVQEISENQYGDHIPDIYDEETQKQKEKEKRERDIHENDLLFEQDKLRVKQKQEKQRLNQFVKKQIQNLKCDLDEIQKQQGIDKQRLFEVQRKEQKLDQNIQDILDLQQLKQVERQYEAMVCRIKQFDKEQEESEPIDEERVKQIYEEEQTKNEQLFKEIENNMQKLDISNVTYGQESQMEMSQTNNTFYQDSILKNSSVKRSQIKKDSQLRQSSIKQSQKKQSSVKQSQISESLINNSMKQSKYSRNEIKQNRLNNVNKMVNKMKKLY